MVKVLVCYQARGGVAGHGCFVLNKLNEDRLEWVRKELADKGLKTWREQHAARPEQSWDTAMRAVHTEVKGDFPAYPAPAISAPAQVTVPEPYLVSAWSVGAGNLMRAAGKGANGKWFFRDPPYQALAHETHLSMRVLDLMGRHEEARDGYEMWLKTGGGVDEKNGVPLLTHPQRASPTHPQYFSSSSEMIWKSSFPDGASIKRFLKEASFKRVTIRPKSFKS